MNKELRIVHSTDGSFAICDYTQVNSHVGIWSPISSERYETEIQAKIALAHIRGEQANPNVTESHKIEQAKPTRKREDFRIVKYERCLFGVEQRICAKWVTVAKKTTVAKAEQFIINQIINGN